MLNLSVYPILGPSVYPSQVILLSPLYHTYGKCKEICIVFLNELMKNQIPFRYLRHFKKINKTLEISGPVC